MNDRQAILFLCHKLNRETLDRFDALEQPDGFDKWLLCDTTGISLKECDCGNRRIFGFDYEQLVATGYLPIRNKIVPGSNHFPVLEFASEHDCYKYIWLVEYDVMYTGDWSKFFTSFPDRVDFLSTRIMTYTEHPTWPWWNAFEFQNQQRTIPIERRWSSFNPLYRLSRKAATYLRNAFLTGCRGHHEVSMPTVLIEGEFCVEEIGGLGTRTPNSRKGKHYHKNTYRWRPLITETLTRENCLYHPVK